MRSGSIQLALLVTMLSACAPDVPAGEIPVATADPSVVEGERLGGQVEWGEIEHFDVADDGRVAVMDRHRIKLAILGATTGVPDSEFGSVGDGPGELRLGGAVVLIGDTVVIADEGRLSSWTTEGTHLSSAPGIGGSQLHAHPRGGFVLMTPTTGLDQHGIHASRYSAAELNPSEPPGLLGDPAEVCGGCQVVPLGSDRYLVAPFDPDWGPLVVGPDSTVEWIYPVERIEWEATEWNDHMNVQRARARYATTSPRLRSIFEGPTRTAQTPPDRPKRLVREGGLGVGEGSVVVLAQVGTGAASALDLFTLDGRYEGRVALDRTGVLRISVQGDWLVALARDELDRPELWRYRVRDLRRALPPD